jgi:ATP-dependent helicase YprA (DUF1998 family)/very-short-patch-repair endonuclease
MNVFELRIRIVQDYSGYVRSFLRIRDPGIERFVDQTLTDGALWPDPLIQLNPAFQPGAWMEELTANGTLHAECARVFRTGKSPGAPHGAPLRLHQHQLDAIRAARTGANYALTTGTGSGKSLAYLVPIVDHVLRVGSGRGVRAIVVYPMNALANSQLGELEKFLKHGYADGQSPVTFARYTGQESQDERDAIMEKAPDVILTNYVMLELMLTRTREEKLIKQAGNLRFLVLDELHTYRGRQGADVALLVRRVRERLGGPDMQCVGTSATLAGAGTLDEQRVEVADVASRLFGAPVQPQHIIGETLRRMTPHTTLDDPSFRAALTSGLREPRQTSPTTFAAFVADPLSSWLESTFGVEPEAITGRLIRARPKSITGPEGAAALLAKATGVDEARCAGAIMEGLLGGGRCGTDPETNLPAFAFRLHQFVSRGDTIYSTLEHGDERYLTLNGQQFAPGTDRQKVLLPLVFCRECGQEFFAVRLHRDKDTGVQHANPRELSDRMQSTGEENGFLYASASNPWSDAPDQVVAHAPEEWLEEFKGKARVKRDFAKLLPRAMHVATTGVVGKREAGAAGIDGHFVAAPFRFCLNCRVSYSGRSTSDFGKMSELGSAGRSTATTILSLAAVRYLKHDADLEPRAQKLLSFTDNRQDASLQAGHFNDFVEIGLLRSALYRAVADAGDAGVRHDEVAQRVVQALELPLAMYAQDPDILEYAQADVRAALENVIAYRVYRDLKRGWRITLPNLEQTGLLAVAYRELDRLCRDESVWVTKHAALQTASPEQRLSVTRVLLDHMRRELAIRVDYLDEQYWTRIQQQSSQHLIAPWAIDEQEKQERSAVLYPRSRGKKELADNVYLSGRTAFGQFLRRKDTFPAHKGPRTVVECETIIVDLLDALRRGALVTRLDNGDPGDPAFQLSASAMVWHAGSGVPPHDPLRTPTASEQEKESNAFFSNFYRETARTLAGIEAREHTAQVYHEVRESREADFREGKLAVLFCSPTMELGVDISDLNVVGLRNVPPTPANYAQRSGRAGRSGHPALVFTYCAGGSSHDQYFFKRPDRMVAGAVTPPRLDLGNEDLVRAHVQAVWLAEADLNLGKSLTDVLYVEGDAPTLAIRSEVAERLESAGPRAHARARAGQVLLSILADLKTTDWYSDEWLDGVLQKIPQRFEQACERWRELYRAAHEQHKIQNAIIRDASRSDQDKKEARRIVHEAQAQLRLLTDDGASDGKSTMQSDFYSYRYFASEGFLPGYNFPRLPLSAFIPGRGRKSGRDEFLSRPRFLAVSEFGPRAIIYHEGSRYIINKAILPVGSDDLITSKAKQCSACGYLHPIADGLGPDLCERCKAALPQPLHSLFRLQNVATKRKDRIVSDEEERMRFGYDLSTGVRFGEHDGRLLCRTATVVVNGVEVARLTYAHAATLWRINLGWKRRKPDEPAGFVLDVERGYWASNQMVEDDEDKDPTSPKHARVIPFVEDTRNCLLIEPLGVGAAGPDVGFMASMQAALKSAIQVVFQLEDAELAAEPLPDVNERRLLLLYESAEGGAGVLRQLIDRSGALAEVGRRALEICHFTANGVDVRRAPRSSEDCEAACYDCLMSYGNQMDHGVLDRQAIKPFLLQLAQATVVASPTEVSRAAHVQFLLGKTESGLEREFVQWLDTNGYRLPSTAQKRIDRCHTKPDFEYEDVCAAIYVDGSPHDHPDRQARDQKQQAAMEDAGFEVVRFHYADDWKAVCAEHPHIFGSGK